MGVGRDITESRRVRGRGHGLGVRIRDITEPYPYS